MVAVTISLLLAAQDPADLERRLSGPPDRV